MSQILALRAAIANDLRSHTAVAAPDEDPPVVAGRLAGVMIYEHGGEFDNEKELARYAKQALNGAVFVAVLGAEVVQRGGIPTATVTIGAFVLAVNRANRDAMAIAISDAVMNYVARWPSKNWSVAAKAPVNIHAHNLYNEKFDERGAAMWGVFWQQDIELKTSPEPVLNSFLEMDLTYEVADE